ncbi:DUF6817 domain-containing protein [Massilia sp. CF038]|uniref:DUF6817 domain-containing protein n=1 Tax=Massilia sp. CF038 TaxID=1881045 RepID=UPI0009135A5A|nr:hypothetical protein [Massilia sp. CF038]SHG61228.1 hypothetical protein SAMN05428948_1280 [Massilia sp. CF038]
MLDTEKYRSDLLRLGTHKVAHQDQTLLEHMIRVSEILQDMQAAPDVCLAGLFHGVYGTEGLHNDDVEAIPEAKRIEVRAIVGPSIEQMIFNFSVMNYASMGKSLRNLMRPKGNPEMKDRRTGAPIAMERDEFEDLLRLKLGDVLAHLPAQVGHSQLNLPAEYGSFWKLAAEYLGPEACATWNKFMEGPLWIDMEQM